MFLINTTKFDTLADVAKFAQNDKNIYIFQ